MTIEDEHGNFIRGTEAQPCWHCRQPTTWIEVNFEAHMHPGECETWAWAEFDAASYDARHRPVWERDFDAEPPF